MVNILELWKKCFWLIVKVGNDLCIKWRKRLQFEPNLHGVRFQPGRSTTILVSWPRGVPTVIQKYGSSSRWEMLTSDPYGRRKKQFISLSLWPNHSLWSKCGLSFWHTYNVLDLSPPFSWASSLMKSWTRTMDLWSWGATGWKNQSQPLKGDVKFTYWAIQNSV